ncbi:MAG: P1 family peptidase [Syntrophobacteraceae bacterium]|jgi:L-aminopeptidase/D-esterase-like protein|nr:P1 family peptidase [Syntrophobacteraceae bacterium]
MENDTLTAVEGIRVGHAALPGVLSGCTVILPVGGATAGVDVRGGAPATCGTDTLNPLNLVHKVHGIFFAGGSTYGMGVAEGVKRYLRERSVGFESGYGPIPIVGGAMIFDLNLNRSDRFPDADLGYECCMSATSQPVPQGSVGAGIGASVGKIHGLERAMKGGVGSSCVEGASGLKVAALMVVNAFGNIVDPAGHRTIAGCREDPGSLQLVDADLEMRRLTRLRGFPDGRHTIIGAVATNVKLTKRELTKVAQMAHDGLARTVIPAHTLYDGDTIFALSHGTIEGVEVTIVGALAAQAVADAVLKAARAAESLGGLPAHRNLPKP